MDRLNVIGKPTIDEVAELVRKHLLAAQVVANVELADMPGTSWPLEDSPAVTLYRRSPGQPPEIMVSAYEANGNPPYLELFRLSVQFQSVTHASMTEVDRAAYVARCAGFVLECLVVALR